MSRRRVSGGHAETYIQSSLSIYSLCVRWLYVIMYRVFSGAQHQQQKESGRVQICQKIMEKNKFSGNFTASFHIKWMLVLLVV